MQNHRNRKNSVVVSIPLTRAVLVLDQSHNLGVGLSYGCILFVMQNVCSEEKIDLLDC